jgi:hypothetical protein
MVQGHFFSAGIGLLIRSECVLLFITEAIVGNSFLTQVD